jgi:dCMP deaminase
MNNNKWDRRFLELAYLVASWSKDPSTKCGCVIAEGNRIVSLGYNGYPASVKDSNDTREDKLEKTIHAEVNAILHAKRDLSGCSLYVVPMQPCARCASIVIQSKISRIVTVPPSSVLVDRWGPSFVISQMMFKEADIPVMEVDI